MKPERTKRKQFGKIQYLGHTKIIGLRPLVGHAPGAPPNPWIR